MPTGMRRMQLPTATLALSGVPARGAHEDRLKQTPQLERLVFGVLTGNILKFFSLFLTYRHAQKGPNNETRN